MRVSIYRGFFERSGFFSPEAAPLAFLNNTNNFFQESIIKVMIEGAELTTQNQAQRPKIHLQALQYSFFSTAHPATCT